MQFNYILKSFFWSTLVNSSVFRDLLSLMNKSLLILVERIRIMNSAIAFPLEFAQFVNCLSKIPDFSANSIFFWNYFLIFTLEFVL